ncbi:thioesterase domain protein [Talaromyces proteolyticus]|uniref:Thioesterase domain protein n=1 Tax=Talaromyces proteolyticus TaxID=1131652 RepID=A0AAD4KL91_9EURO|nr:thioesterase domain protein [Talaromyces proteolyticus]KAH8690691.1 thioesterase domain protein [Talaromyces proteolyticus]
MTGPTPKLYAGETLDTVSGFPTLYNFFPADASKPIVVFIPGAGHNARIAYGGHEGSSQKDFLAYWINGHGYGFLAVSYPLENTPAIMPAIAPQFRIRDWGKQAAEVTHHIIKQHNLSSRVVLLCWSMAGRIVVPYSIAAKSVGLHVDLFVSLAASPGMHGTRPPPPGITCSASGYAVYARMIELFLIQIHEQENNLNHGRTIIPDEVFKREYFGFTPVSLLGWNLGYDRATHGQKFSEDLFTSTKDAAVDQAENLPVIAALTGHSVLDARHLIMDQATWTFMLMQKFMRTIEISKGVHGLTQAQGTRLAKMAHSIPGRISMTIPGNHYFFIGECGARETAQAIIDSLEMAATLEHEFDTLLNS